MHDQGAPRKQHADTAQDARYRLRAFLWDFDGRSAKFTPRVAGCGRRRVAQYVQVKAGGSSSALGGVRTCGSVWLCPVCSATVAARRSVELADTIRAHREAGGSVVLASFTLAHSRKHRLADSWDAVTIGWKAVRNGGGWRADKAAFGIVGYCRVIEVTHGRNGWHPHAHVLLFTKGPITADQADTLRGRMFARWSDALAGAGYGAVEFDPATGKPVAVDVRVLGPHDGAYVADYVTKFGYHPRSDSAGLAVEVTRGDLKRGRKSSRTPWQILESAARGSESDAALWAEWETASHGRRQYAWAAGFRDSLDLDSVITDQEAAEREAAGLDVVALLPAPSWAKLVENLRAYRTLPGAPLMTRMLGQAATLPPDVFRRWLTRAGIEHLDPADVAAAGSPTPDRFDPLNVPAPAPAPGRLEVGTFGNRRDQAHRHRLAGVRITAEPAPGGWRRDQAYPVAGDELQPARPPVVPPGVTLRSPGASAARVRALYGL